VATYLEQSLAKLKEFEGCVPWMYRDTVGKITVGVGLMLPDATGTPVKLKSQVKAPEPDAVALPGKAPKKKPLSPKPVSKRLPTGMRLDQSPGIRTQRLKDS